MKHAWLIITALGTAFAPWQALALGAYMDSETHASAPVGTVAPRVASDAVVSSNGRVECQSTSGSCGNVATIDMAYNNPYYGERYYYRDNDDRNTRYSYTR